jgi:hypothetical protein
MQRIAGISVLIAVAVALMVLAVGASDGEAPTVKPARTGLHMGHSEPKLSSGSNQLHAPLERTKAKVSVPPLAGD